MEKCWCGNCSLKEYSEDYYMCDKCGSLVSKYFFSDSIYQVSDEEKDLYGKNYWFDTMLHEAGVENVTDLIDLYLNGRAVYWLQFALKYFKLGGTIAEVGCGLGQFAYLLKKSGFFPMVYELSEEICQYIRETIKIPVICGEMIEQEQKFDAIVAMDVFEHLMYPQKFLDIVLKNLKEDGVLCIQLPCYDRNLNFEEMVKEKPNFRKLLVKNQHVYLYSKESIQKILINSGFQYIQFEHAFFGDDYDMFLFASKTKIQENEQNAIENFLNKVDDGNLIRAHLNLYSNEEQYKKELVEKEKVIQSLTIACKERLEAINKLSVQVNERDLEIKKLETACEERLQSVCRLTKLNAEKDSQIEIFRNAAEERLQDIIRLNELLKGK